MSETTTVLYPKLDPDFKRRWVEALRSGKYLQTQNRLKKQLGKEMSYCCLGVACEIEKVPIDMEAGMSGWLLSKNSDIPAGHFSRPMLEPLVLRVQGDMYSMPLQAKLVEMNDNKSMSFKDIADWIEVNL